MFRAINSPTKSGERFEDLFGGSLLGGALLPNSGPQPLALTGGLLTLAALAVLAVDARPRTARPAPDVPG
ncbi:hypothetical protein AB0C02_07480 [Micromonospora sp. NPDC048999]|uniref:hypothetical protein n=1 Tax=Micromonospora sp. NPDC048999 TaxID=3155391 RepID=UPI0033D71DFA